jgi:hypothetical protein
MTRLLGVPVGWLVKGYARLIAAHAAVQKDMTFTVFT